MIDETHDAARASWVGSANGHADFPIQNLPFGVFCPPGEDAPRGGVAIGDQILDLKAALSAGLFTGEAETAAIAASGATLNPLMALEPVARRTLRRRLSDLLDQNGADRKGGEALASGLLHRAADCMMRLPAHIGDYTDFYAGIHHARAVGQLYRSDNPLLPNYKHVPIGYHGRASSVRPSGTPVVRPDGQRLAPGAESPSFGPSTRLDYELELGLWVSGANALGEPVPIKTAGERLFGVSLLNDWSARDVQAWEYQPLGPFLAKSFLTTVSPWVVTMEALAPFRTAQPARPAGDPQPLPYLTDPADQAAGALAITLEVWLSTPAMRDKGLAPQRLSRSAAADLYWTPAQLIAHHACGGCNLSPGDLMGTGTISGPDAGGSGSLLELSLGGKAPITLASGETRAFLQDGDEVTFTGVCRRDGYAGIGLGACSGRVQGRG